MAPSPPRTTAWPNRRQATALSWIYFAYVCCYLVRKNYPLLLPALAARGLLSTAEAGAVASVFEIVVGAVKFFCGVFVDRAPDPGRLLARCLAVAGASCLAMQGVFWAAAAWPAALGGAWARVPLVALFWSANGAGQAVAWPALARVFLAWFPDARTRGTWYSVLATNQNLGGTLAPRAYPPLMARFGWAVALWAPACLALAYAAAMAARLRSAPGPGDVAHAAVADADADAVADADADADAKRGDAERGDAERGGKRRGQAARAAKAPPPPPGFVETFRHLVGLRPFVCLSLAYIPIMVVRQSLINWTAVLFADAGLSLFAAGACLASLELGGFAGGLAGGVISDRLCGGRRGPVMAVFALCCAPVALALRAALALPAGAAVLLPWPLGATMVPRLAALHGIFFLAGFFSFPPHSLIGLTAREISPVAMRSTAGCLAKAVGQIGAASAGWPLQALAQRHGWGVAVGTVNAAAAVVAAAAFLPLWRVTGAAAAKKKTR